MNDWFEELSLKRKKFDDSVQENNFEKGIRRSTVEKYPDPVHFIYELLQNAEDQDATKVQFALSAGKLVFRHNGNAFTKSDVENITGIGNSDKTQEANKIGRFGIGFKSVFAITNRPEIYTLVEGNHFAFAIEHLVVPVSIPGGHAENHPYHTQFIFPFINGQEAMLYSKIKERLSTLGFEALLFLQNLTSIEWQTERDHGTYIHKFQDVQHNLSEESWKDGQLQQSNAKYLMFTRNVQISNNERRLDVCIAFKLNEKGSIIAEPGQRLAVYFPTEQVTGLKFRVHGPFLLTDNRANIKSDNETNRRLLQECAILLGESIQKVKEASLLTIDFLSLLPIRKDIPVQFMPLYYEVLEVLKQYPLLPTADGRFANATTGKLARGAGLRDLIDDQQLSSLYGVTSSLHWLSSEITDDRVPDLYQYVTKELKVEVISPEIFVRKLEKSFLQQQTDAWLVKLYTFLSKQQSLDTAIKVKPILRLEDDSHVSPFKSIYGNEPPNAYLSPKGQGESKFPLIKRSLLVDDVIRTFFKRIDLSEPDIVDEVLEYILPPYQIGRVAIDDETRNRQDLQHIQDALAQKVHLARPRLLTALNETAFIRAINAKNVEKAWKTPQQVYSKTDELSLWFTGNEQAWFIIEPFPEALLRDLNISTHLRPRAKTTTGNTGYIAIRNGRSYQRGLHRFDPDAHLDGLQHVLDHITLKRARLLWNLLLENRHLIKGHVETSSYQSFVNAQRTEKFSEMGELCSQNAWLPDEEGEFYTPDELFLTDIPEAFETNTGEAQEVAQKLGMKKAEVLQLADKLDIPPEFIILIQNDPEAFRVWCNEQQQKPSLPSSITNDPDRRRERATERAYAASGKTYRAVMTNKRVSAEYSAAKAYLRNHNTNENGQLICQLCDREMPFRLPHGEAFFVACQYIDPSEKEYAANHLALCPNCAAEFQYACQTNEQKRADLILAVQITTNEKNLVVHLDMPVHQCLRFTQRHLIDLQMATKDWLATVSDA